MTLALQGSESTMFRSPALVLIVAVSLVAGRFGLLCGDGTIERHQPATCHHAGGHADTTVSVAGNWEKADCGHARTTIPTCVDGNSSVPQAIQQVMPGDTAAALATPIYRLSVRVDVHTPRRPVDERTRLGRRPLSTNLRI
jgi:hypothetical protein